MKMLRQSSAMLPALFAALLINVWGPSQCRGQEKKESSGQLSELQRVQKISELTGRPIFAVAGRST